MHNKIFEFFGQGCILGATQRIYYGVQCSTVILSMSTVYSFGYLENQFHILHLGLSMYKIVFLTMYYFIFKQFYCKYLFLMNSFIYFITNINKSPKRGNEIWLIRFLLLFMHTFFTVLFSREEGPWLSIWADGTI